jgi:hypothetical protein
MKPIVPPTLPAAANAASDKFTRSNAGTHNHRC